MDDDVEPRVSLEPMDRELLLTALEMGYFEIPREATLRDVAAEFDISDLEAKERLARGMSTVLQAYRDDDQRLDGLLDEYVLTHFGGDR